MKQKIIFLLLTLLFINTIYACDCECTGDCSFKNTSLNSEFVALVKVISYGDYLNDRILGYNGKMPYSMIVEITKKYKGSETRKKIKIWGDNGALCRPYIADFKLNEYYLIAPNLLKENHLKSELPTDYDFFSCSTDYLKVDIRKKIAYGEYTKTKNHISLSDFEKQIIK
jgi:hypothetical protein